MLLDNNRLIKRFLSVTQGACMSKHANGSSHESINKKFILMERLKQESGQFPIDLIPFIRTSLRHSTDSKVHHQVTNRYDHRIIRSCCVLKVMLFKYF